MRTAGLATLLLVAGCISIDNDSGGEWIRYSCSNGRTLVARYDNEDSANPRAEIVISGRRIMFAAQRSASGARYATADGLRGGHGLVWWTRGAEASLLEFPLAAAGRETAIAACRQI
jgi:membrane-bound inhibitor of C-type lysozyme